MKRRKLLFLLICPILLIGCVVLLIFPITIVNVVSRQDLDCSSGSPVSAIVKIYNIGLKSLHISDIRTSCNCTENKITRKRVPFLNNSTIYVNFKCPERAKTRTVYLMFDTNDLIRSQRVVKFEATRQDRVICAPQVLNYGMIGRKKTITKTLRVACEGHEEDIGFDLPSDSYKCVKVDKGIYKISLTNNAPPGEIEDIVRVLNNKSGEVMLSIPVTWQSVAEWYCYPDKIFARNSKDFSESQRVRLYSGSSSMNEMPIPELIYDDALLDVKILPRNSRDDFFKIEIRINRDAENRITTQTHLSIDGVQVLTVMMDYE